MKWPITAACAVALGVVLVRWFGGGVVEGRWRWPSPAAVLAFVFPQQPMIPFVFGVVGLSVITSTSRRRNRRMVFRDLDVRQTDHAAAARRRAGGGILPRASGQGRRDSLRVDHGRRWAAIRCGPICLPRSWARSCISPR